MGDKMKPPRSPSSSDRPREHPQSSSTKGMGSAGVPFNPAGVAVELEPRKSGRAVPQVAPAPGVPMSDEQYERLKQDAKTARTPPSKHGQEDLSGRKKA
jgi:hypothetical protein